MLRASQFMKYELPTRLAHRVVELENLPHELSEMPSVIKVKNWYSQSFQELVDFTHFDELGLKVDKHPAFYHVDDSAGDLSISQDKMSQVIEDFALCLENIKKRHDPVVTSLAQGILELKDHWKSTNSPLLNTGNASGLPVSIQAFLDRFYMSRIGIRMLIGQHVTLSKVSLGSVSLPKDYVGIICTKTNIRTVAEDAIDNAKFICQQHYGLWSSPPVKLLLDQDNIEFSYVPSHLHHMLFELLKNSLRAVVERYGVECEDYPEIRIIVAQGQEDITIKVSDEGGGIPRSGMPLIWTYMYTTARNPLLEGEPDDFSAPLAGYGYGLPLSRLYARYFGGDLRLISMDGYGSDAYLHLNKLSDSQEPLP